MALLTPADITSWDSQGMNWDAPGTDPDTNCRPLEWKYMEALRQATLERMTVHRDGTSEAGGYNNTSPTGFRARLENPTDGEPFYGPEYTFDGSLFASSMAFAVNSAMQNMINKATSTGPGGFDTRRNWAIPDTSGAYDTTTGFPYLSRDYLEGPLVLNEPIINIACGAPITWRWAWQMYTILNLMVHYGGRINLGAEFPFSSDYDPDSQMNQTVTKRPGGAWTQQVTGSGVDIPSAIADFQVNWAAASTSSFSGPAGFTDRYAKAYLGQVPPGGTSVSGAAQEIVGAGTSSFDVLPLVTGFAADVDFYSRARIVGNNINIPGWSVGDGAIIDDQQVPTIASNLNELKFLGTVAKPLGDRYAASPKIGDVTIPPDTAPTYPSAYGFESGSNGFNNLAMPTNLAITNISIHRYDVTNGFRFVA